MRKTTIVFFLLSINELSSAQMLPADSLPGTYSGQYWYANPAASPWIKTADTLYVQNNMDSINCTYQAWCANFSIGGSPPASTYYTDYYSCNSVAPSNYYSKFYSGDSVRVIWDNTPQPPPNPSVSTRFYGKRISNKTAGVNGVLSSEQIKVFPNPANDVLTIEFSRIINGKLLITDIIGKEIKCEKINSLKARMDVSSMNERIYFLQVQCAEGVIVKKIVVQH